MKKIALSALIACSFAFAQVESAGASANEEAAFAELEKETQGTEAPSGVADDGSAQEVSAPSGVADAGNAPKESAPEESTPAGSSWEQPLDNTPAANSSYTVDANVREASPVTTAPATPREETWEEAWLKRRYNVSFYMGIFPVTFLADLFVDIFEEMDGSDDSDPDFVAYSVSIGWELFYLLEVGLMVDYTTVAQNPVIAVIPRIKLNWLNFKYFRLYSYGGLGGIFWDGGGYIMFNFAVLGFEVGNHLSLFFEGGWGQVGLFTMGVKFAF